MKCPLCGPDGSGLTVQVHVQPHLTWLGALKLRLAGPEVRAALLDELRLRLTELAMNRLHPEGQ